MIFEKWKGNINIFKLKNNQLQIPILSLFSIITLLDVARQNATLLNVTVIKYVAYLQAWFVAELFALD